MSTRDKINKNTQNTNMITINQLLQFIQNHWAICLSFGTVLALLAYEELKSKYKISGMPKISVLDATLLLNHENTILVDLRDQKIFANRHILGSINIARSDFDLHIKKIGSDKNQNIILLDDTDINAASIGAKLQKHGFDKIHILAGGLQAWKDAHLPLTKN